MLLIVYLVNFTAFFSILYSFDGNESNDSNDNGRKSTVSGFEPQSPSSPDVDESTLFTKNHAQDDSINSPRAFGSSTGGHNPKKKKSKRCNCIIL